jgi:aquaporin Z
LSAGPPAANLKEVALKNYVTEFIGTFFLVLTIGLTVVAGTPFAPLAIGSALMVMVYMGGHVSGAHYNPAVTLAVMMRGKLPAGQVVPYWISQLLGSLAASAVVFRLMGKTFALTPVGGTFHSILVEFLFAFALALVVLNVATAKATEGNSFYGLAIGFTVTVGAFAGGAISGGAFNPAVATGPALMSAMVGHGGLGPLWIYWIGGLLGGAVASAVFKFQHAGAAD